MLCNFRSTKNKYKHRLLTTSVIALLTLSACQHEEEENNGNTDNITGEKTTTDEYTLRAFVDNLNGIGLVLQNNNGDDISPDVNGNVTFPTKLADGANYNVTILTQPSSPSQDCSVRSGTGAGTINGADVSDVWVDCTNVITNISILDQSPGVDEQHVALDEKISFTLSANVYAPSAINANFKVVGPDGELSGDVSNNGAEIIFTPDAPLRSLTEYEVTITNAVEDIDGNSLDANHSYKFNTTVNPGKWYKITNHAQGESKALDTSNPNYVCYMGDNGNYTGQYWRFTPSESANGYYIMQSRFAGEREAMEGANGTNPCLFTGFTDRGNPLSGQLWKISSEGGSFFRLQNLNLGATHSLGATTIPKLEITNINSPSQHWKMTELENVSNVSINQFVYVAGTASYQYGASNAIPNMGISNAPADTDFGRWAMLSNGSSYKMMAIKRGTNDTLYEFVFNSTTEQYVRSSKTYKITDIPTEANPSSIAMLNSDVGEHLYMLDKSGTAIHQFFNTSGNDDFVYGGGSSLPVIKKIDITGGPNDADWSRWAMLNDGGKYRLYAMKNASNDTFYQFVYNPNSGNYEYGYDNAIEVQTITGIPIYSDRQSFAMLHDNSKYRLYMLNR